MSNTVRMFLTGRLYDAYLVHNISFPDKDGQIIYLDEDYKIRVNPINHVAIIHGKHVVELQKIDYRVVC